MRLPYRRLSTVLGAVTAVASVLALSPAPAQAAGYVFDARNALITYEASAWTQFAQDGEILTANDMKRDGHGVAAQWRYNSRSATHSYYNGNGYAVPKSWNLAFDEGTTLEIRACLQEGSSGTPYNCGGWEYAKA